MKHIRKIALAIGAVSLATSALAQVPETRKPIKFATADWTGSYITAGLMRGILEDMGYRTEEVVADQFAWYPAMSNRDIDVAMEAWTTTQGEVLNAAVADGTVVELGGSGLQAIETWWYPTYVKELCPGLPDYRALNDCVDVFKTAETGDQGRYLSGPVTWGGFDKERIDALGLNFKVVYPGTDAAMFAELDSAYTREEPILMWIYSPHWAPAKYDGEFVEFPTYTDECYSDPSWGSNPDLAYDCAKPRGPVNKVAATGALDDWPCAMETIRNFSLTNKEYGDLWAQVDLDAMSVEDVVSGWLSSNADRWKSWQACQG